MDFDTSLLLGFVAVMVAAVAVIAYPYMAPIDVPVGPTGHSGQDFKEIPRFQSYSDLKAAFEEAGSGVRNGMWETMGGVAVPMAANADSAGKAVSEEQSSDFSTTNVQVQGVDEADIVKTDGKYVYNFAGEKLVITDAYPVEGSKIVSETRLGRLSPIEMFVSGDRLLLFGSEYVDYGCEDCDGIKGVSSIERMPYYWGGSRAVVRLYDISDRASPVLEKELEFEGSYLASRLVGENAYFVVNSWPSYRECDESNEECMIPMMADDGVEKKVAEATEIGYLLPMPVQSFVTIASMNLGSGALEKETIAGSAQGVFASQENIYVEASVWIPRETLLPEGTPAGEIERAVWGDTEETVVNKFGLAEGKIGFIGQGRVPGRVLNQFSMDEFEGNFRIATTIGWNGSSSLYVLNKEMETIGTLEGLAPGESIYSARFMGQKAYLVTFKKVDPLFVIDLSNPEEPKVLGKLKIPGYSDYLHPIDETHIIGIGKETIESAKGDFAWYQGMKMAIFDVSDVANPVEMHKIVIGDRGTDSYALQDHKAFLYDKEKELLVLPIMLAEIPESGKKPLDEGQAWPAYGEFVFQGAFVFRVNLEEGFVERGRITHITPEEELKRGYYFGDDYSVKRALYIGDVLYTLSGKMLKANGLQDLDGLKEFVFGAS